MAGPHLWELETPYLVYLSAIDTYWDICSAYDPPLETDLEGHVVTMWPINKDDACLTQ